MSAVEEHLAARRNAGLFDFSFMALYEYSGLGLLQGLQSRNLRATQPGQIAYTLMLQDDGSVIIDATVWRLDTERYWLFIGRREAFGGRDRSGEFAILALQGPASGRLLAQLIGADAVRGLRYFHFLEKDGLIVGRVGFSGELGYELLVPAAQAPALRQKILRSGDVRECGWAAADSLRIESGYILFDREIDGRANPRELGLERLVDAPRNFALQRKLVGLEILEGQARTGLASAQETSECFSPTLGKAIALGYAPPHAAPGDAACLEDGRLARIARLPFYDPERRRPRAAPL